MPTHSRSAEIDIKYRDRFFHWGKNFATSIRLFGADDEFFPPQVVHIIPHPDVRYELPGKLLLNRDEIISRLIEESRQRGTMFYDGPNTRLLDYHLSPVDQTEQKHIYLHLGPVGWYDYSVCRWALDQAVKRRTTDEIQEYLDLDKIADSQIVRNNKLSNILCTATTLITSDRFILYSRRGQRVSSIPGRLTSSVAENIHPVFDGSLQATPDDGFPAPFKTVLRGIEEEISPKIARRVRKHRTSMFLLGLDFDLLNFQPDLLFVVFLPFCYEEVQEVCRQHPGKDFIEGHTQAVSISQNHDDLNELLSEPNWIPGGKASLIRALEFLDSVEEANPDLQFEDLIGTLEEKTSQHCPTSDRRGATPTPPLGVHLGRSHIEFPSELIHRLRETLACCSDLESDRALRALFVDARLAPWRNLIPDNTPNRAVRVNDLINTLYDRTNTAGENALVLFLHILADNTDSADALHAILTFLAEELAFAINTNLTPVLIKKEPVMSQRHLEKAGGVEQRHRRPILGQIQPHNSSYGMCAVDRVTHQRFFNHIRAYPLSTVGLIFDVTNPNALNMRLIRFFVDVVEYIDVDIPYVDTGPMGGGAMVRKFVCQVDSRPARYECKQASEGFDYIKLTNGEMETFRINVIVPKEGVYRLMVALEYSIAGETQIVEADDDVQEIGFFDPACHVIRDINDPTNSETVY